MTLEAQAALGVHAATSGALAQGSPAFPFPALLTPPPEAGRIANVTTSQRATD